MIEQSASVVAHDSPLTFGSTIGARSLRAALSVPSFHGIANVRPNFWSEVAGVIVCVQIVALHTSGRAKGMPLLQASKHFAFAFVVHERDPVEFGIEIMNPENFAMTSMNMRHSDVVYVKTAVVTWPLRDWSVFV